MTSFSHGHVIGKKKITFSFFLFVACVVLCFDGSVVGKGRVAPFKPGFQSIYRFIGFFFVKKALFNQEKGP